MLNRFYFKKRTATFLISILFSIFVFSAVPTLAAGETRPDDKEGDLKVYYSEALGAGEKVYHFTACKKVPSYAPLRCSDVNKDTFAKQCKTTKGELIKGAIIKGCLKDPQPKDADHLIVDVSSIDQLGPVGCKDFPEKHAPYYAPEYAVVKFDAEKNGISQGSIAWDSGRPPPEVISEVYKGEGGEVRRAYRTGLCVKWDEIVDKESRKLSDEQKQKIEAEKSAARGQITGVEEIAKKLVDEGCNNDNSAESPSFEIEEGKAPPPIVHCTIYERLTGKTGVELFAKYVGAIYRWLATIVGIVSVLIIVVSGIQISMAGGDTGGIDKAKNRIMQSLLGLAILFLSGLILYTINPGFFTG